MAKIRQSNLDEAIVTGLTELSESRADGDFVMVYDSSSGTLKKIQASNLGLVGPKISSVSPTNALSGDGTGNHTFTITGTNFAVGATAKLINSSGTDVAFDTLTRDSSTQLTGVIAKSSLPGSGEPYDVSVTASQITVTLADQINIDQSPEYVTSAGSLATILNGDRDSTTLEVIASDPESAGNVTFELQSGSLPAGATATTVHENGVSKYQISGFSAVGSNTTSNFTLRAVDTASNTTSRAFSITVNAPVSESFTSNGTFSVPVGVSSVEVLVVGGGGGGGSPNNGGGGGAGGLVYMTAFPVTPGGTVSVTVGPGGAANCNGVNSTFGTLVGYAGGAGGGQANGGNIGGSGGGGGQNATAGTANQPTQPGNSGAYGFGNPGGFSNGCAGHAGAGGGGAGSAGANSQFVGSPSWGGNGGDGKAYTIADGTTPVYYAGGGNGLGPNGTNTNPLAVAAGGGTGQGTGNRGSGGGYTSCGGKGVVIVRY
jgi:hypothetical protein